MSLLLSLLMVTGAIVCSAPIGWLILQAGKCIGGDDKNKNNSQAKRNNR